MLKYMSEKSLQDCTWNTDGDAGGHLVRPRMRIGLSTRRIESIAAPPQFCTPASLPWSNQLMKSVAVQRSRYADSGWATHVVSEGSDPIEKTTLRPHSAG